MTSWDMQCMTSYSCYYRDLILHTCKLHKPNTTNIQPYLFPFPGPPVGFHSWNGYCCPPCGVPLMEMVAVPLWGSTHGNGYCPLWGYTRGNGCCPPVGFHSWKWLLPPIQLCIFMCVSRTHQVVSAILNWWQVYIYIVVAERRQTGVYEPCKGSYTPVWALQLI